MAYRKQTEIHFQQHTENTSQAPLPSHTEDYRSKRLSKMTETRDQGKQKINLNLPKTQLTLSTKKEVSRFTE